VAADGSLAGWELTTRTPDATLRLALPPESAVRGPADGRVAVATDDGNRSEIRLVSPSGCGDLVHTTGDVVRQAIVMPGRGAVIFHAVSRNERADLGIWRLAIAGERSIRRVLPPLEPGDPLLADVGLVWSTELRADLDGTSLAAESCGEILCRSRVVALHEVEAPGPRIVPGHVVGLDRRHVVTLRDCDGLRCALFSTEVASGRDRLLAAPVSSATTLVRDGRLYAAAITASGTGTFLVVDPASGARPATRALGTASDGSAEAAIELRLLPAGGAAGAGVEGPPGWVGATADPGAGLVAIDVAGILATSSEESAR
jgi:hypothetical protein